MRYFITLCFLLLSVMAGAQSGTETGVITGSERVQLPYNRFVQSAGKQIFFGDEGMESHALDLALSPDKRWIAVMERTSVVFIDTRTDEVSFVLKNNFHPLLRGANNTYSGIQWFENNGKTEVYWSVVNNDDRSFVASATWDGTKAEFGNLLEYRGDGIADMALPNEILVNRESDRNVIYVVLNGNNKVIKQDLATGDTIWIADPGVAPYGIAMARGKLYVTNWAARTPLPGDTEVAGIPWGKARVDNKAGGSTREGSLTVIDSKTGTKLKELIVGLHPNEIVSDSQGRFVYLTNSNSDNVMVINTLIDEVTETVSVRLQPEINPFFGDSPNGLCLSDDEKHLLVANGMDNALAVIRLSKKSAKNGRGKTSTVTGFIPTGAYPSGVAVMPGRGNIYTANLEAVGARLPSKTSATANPIYNSHNMLASVSSIPFPDTRTLQSYTDTVIALNDLSRAILAREKPRNGISPKTVPDRIGEPSVFKHVLYIIKENRTYDQVLGDMPQGKGDPGLCTYGANITPNTHRLCEEFLLLDNFHVSGKCSAEGHQWTDASIVTDYIEKNMRAWFRSYPHVQEDALVYAPTGFIWDNALKHGRTVRIYGEASSPVFKQNLSWTDVYNMYRNGEKVPFKNVTTIESVKNILSPTFPSYGPHIFTDLMRADDLIGELHKYEAMPGDSLPELMIIALPNDHTAGLRPGFPTPRAMVADNDLALGKIVEAFSKSRFWESTVIFVVEDDSQGGWDHVSSYRTVALVISPYSRLKKTISTHYTQPSMVRTIEQILGMPPMNIQDAIANPMADCFTTKPDLTPYIALPSNIPIDEMNPPLSSLRGKALHFAKKSMQPEFGKVDSGNDDLLNRILWFAEKGNLPYPAKYAGAKKNERDDDEPED